MATTPPAERMTLDDIRPGDINACRRFYLQQGSLTPMEVKLMLQVHPAETLLELLDVMEREAWQIRKGPAGSSIDWTVMPDE